MFTLQGDAGDFGSPFLGSNTGDLTDVLKSLSAGYDSAVGGADPSGYALRPESLEDSMAILVHQAKHIQFFKRLKTTPAFSSVEEFNQLTSYGPEAINAGMSEGVLPQRQDAEYRRQLLSMKYMGTTRSVTHQFGIMRQADGDRIANETRNGTMWLMRQVEKACFNGSSSLVDTQFDGLDKLLADAITAGGASASQLVDMRTTADNGLGGELDQDDLDSAAQLVFDQPSFGQLTDIYYPLGVHRRLGQNLLGSSNMRLNVDNSQGGPVKPGFSFSAVSTLFGDVNVNPDVFLAPTGYTEAQLTDAAIASAADEGTPPGVPSIVLAETGTDGLFGSQTGVYKYIVIAINRAGNSVGCAAVSHTLTGGTKRITVAITKGTGTPTGYIVYRTLPGASTFYEIARIAYTASPQTFNDTNDIIAGTAKAFALEFSPEVIRWRQLLPFTRIPLAFTTMKSQWVQVLYGALELRIPRRIVVWKNLLAV